jgi:hypothetical protein
MLNKDMKKNKKYKSQIVQSILRKKLLPEPQPNSELLLIGLPSAALLRTVSVGDSTISFQ